MRERPVATGQKAQSMTPRRARQIARELAGQGHLLWFWKLPGEGRALSLRQARPVLTRN
jgi:muconolactone delta-isomerase